MRRRGLLLCWAALGGCATGGAVLRAGDGRIQALERAEALHDGGHYREARSAWLGLLGARDRALEIVAAEKLLALDGEMGDEAELAEKVVALAPRLGFEARQVALEMVARIRRRRGDETGARAIDRARGCIERYAVGPVLGPLAHLDLDKPRPAADAPGREVRSHACRATLLAPDGRPGALGTTIPLPAASALVVIDTGADWLLWRDGRVLFRNGDPGRAPPRVVWLRVRRQGGPLELRLAAPAGRVEIGAAALEADRAPRGEIEAVPLPETSLSDPALRLVRASLLLHRGEPDAAEAVLGGDRDARALLLRAYAASIDPSRPPGTARERARAFLEQALAADPQALRAAYNLALLDLQDDRAREALARLEGGAPRARFWAWQALYAQALRARGLAADADRALAEAEQLEPGACALKGQLQAAARDRRDFAGERRAAESFRACDAESAALADLCAARGDHACAAAEYQRLLDADPERGSLRLPLADALRAHGDAARAAKVLGELAAAEPRQPHYRVRLADALMAAGDEAGARRALEEASRLLPESLEIWRSLELLGAPGPLDAFRVDGRQVIADYAAHPPVGHNAQAPAVVLLDRTVTRAFANGARLTLTHNIIRVQTKAGIDRWGEVQIPPGSDVLTLRTVKADGTTREPEEIGEKESVSVPDLLPGDYVELEYVEAAPAPEAFPGGFLAPRFFFSTYEAPLDRTEYVIATPQGLPIDLDVRGQMAAHERLERAHGLEIRTYARQKMAELVPEPGAIPVVETDPSVRVSAGVTFAKWRDFLRESATTAWRANRELEALAKSRCAGKPPHDCAAALAVWVADNVEHGGTIYDPASFTLARRQGNRTGLLGALLQAAGLPVELWLLRPLGADATAPVPQEIDDFDQPVLRAADGWLDPRTRRLLPFELSPLLRGVVALRIAGTGPLFDHTPGRDGDARKVALSARLPTRGDEPVAVTAREDVAGWLAVEWREGLDRLDPDRVRQDFEQRSLGYFFPGAKLEALSFRGRDAGRGPLGMDYRFSAPRLCRSGRGGRLSVGPVLPSQVGRRYVTLPQRRTALQLGFFAPTDLDVRLQLPPGARAEPPPPVVIATPFGRFSQRVAVESGALHLVRHLEIPIARVSPADYRRFQAFARAIDEAEQAEIPIVLGPAQSRPVK